ncbi:SLOG family protein [Pseudomonas laurylsulfatiphila]|uniref:SLOG family protein n=1 Tax=Pseudomonas laurylsulfatiphila TaxID=2011015 RepID=UPI003D2258A7
MDNDVDNLIIKLVIAGGRDFNDMQLLKSTLNDNYLKFGSEIEVVCGMARGADMLGFNWAKEVGAEIHEFKADWDGLGKSAGYRRNEDMAKFGTAVLAFWDGKSKGTKHMIDLAKKHGKPLKVVMY